MMISRKILTAILVIVAIALPDSAISAENSWVSINKEVATGVNQAVYLFGQGEIKTAKAKLSDAYFEIFEAQGMEMVIRGHISAARAYELERFFAKIRKAMTAKNSDEVEKLSTDLLGKLQEDAESLDKKGIGVDGFGYGPVTPVNDISDAKDKELTQEAKIVKVENQFFNIAKRIDEILKEAAASFKNGAVTIAQDLVSDAYFDEFEGKGLETRIFHSSKNLKAEIESDFAYLLGIMEQGHPVSEVLAATKSLSNKITAIALDLDGEEGGFLAMLLASFFIIFREGFEAILIISALIAYLKKTGGAENTSSIAWGATTAIAASIITAYLFVKLVGGNSASQEILEGITLLIAASVLFYLSYWLTSKSEAAKWMSYLKSQVESSPGSSTALGLGFVSFIVVYREGAEMILFYAALLSSGQGTSMMAPTVVGFLIGLIALLALYYLFAFGVAKIPTSLFFNVTGAVTYYMSFVFAGKGIVELQIGGMIGVTPVSWAPSIGFLGVSPTAESMLAQGLIVFAALFALFYLFILPRLKANNLSLNNFHYSDNHPGQAL